jgi:hypothetical protein
MPHIEMPYTDRTGTTHAAACFAISQVRLQLLPPMAEMELAIYHDAAAMNSGKDPIEYRPPFPLTDAEINTYVGQFALAAYQILLVRTEFSSGHIVT